MKSKKFRRNYIWASWTQKTYLVICPEPLSQFSQTRSHFFQNHKMNPIKLLSFEKYLDLGFWDLKTSLGQLETKDVSSHKSETLALIFTSRISISSQLSHESNKIMKFQNNSWPWDLGPGKYIWTIWAQETYRAICLEA